LISLTCTASPANIWECSLLLMLPPRWPQGLCIACSQTGQFSLPTLLSPSSQVPTPSCVVRAASLCKYSGPTVVPPLSPPALKVSVTSSGPGDWPAASEAGNKDCSRDLEKGQGSPSTQDSMTSGGSSGLQAGLRRQASVQQRARVHWGHGSGNSGPAALHSHTWLENNRGRPELGES
jgi:hypothetical protein